MWRHWNAASDTVSLGRGRWRHWYAVSARVSLGRGLQDSQNAAPLFQPAADSAEEDGSEDEVSQAGADDGGDDDVDVEGHDEQHEEVGQQDVQCVEETAAQPLQRRQSAKSHGRLSWGIE